MPLTVREYDDREPWIAVVDPETFEARDLNEPTNQQEVGAVRFPVAGTGFRLRDARRPEFAVARTVTLVPDKRNRHDRLAIAVRSLDGKRLAGYVPRPQPPYQAQTVIHGFLRQGGVDAIVVARDEEQGNQGPFLSMWIVAAPRLEIVERPWPDDPDYKEFREHALQAEGRRWPEERRQLRSQVQGSVIDRHFALQALAQRAYELRRHHPDALEDAEAACREQIDLAPMSGPALRQEFGEKPSHHGYKQLAIILEKRGHHREALVVVDQAAGQGWSGDWEKRRQRLLKRIEKADAS